MMKVVICLLLPLAAWCAPASLTKEEVISDDSLKPLIRTKRTEEQILFGNHQNNAQFVKKSDPSLSLHDEDAVIDKKSSVSAVATPTQAKDADTTIDDKPDDNDDEENAKDENAISKETDVKVPEEDSQSSGEAMEGNVDDSPVDPSNYYYYDYYYPYSGGHRNKLNVNKEKRSAPQKRSALAKPLIAENMADSLESRAVARTKRDLTADEIYEWLENGGETPREDYVENDTPDFDDTWDQLALDKLIEEYAEAKEEPQVEYPVYDYPQEEEEEDPNNKELLSLLEYLVKNEAPVEENPLSELYPEDIQEQWEDVEEDSENIPYEPIVYNGVPGVFIPVEQDQVVSKRQYMSMVPGVRKRNDFYPYSMEPEGGRWGAFVDREEAKRSDEAYERLLRMAQALNPPVQGYYEGSDYKK